MILSESGNIDYAGSYSEADTDKCISCGDVFPEDELNFEGLCEVCAWDYIEPEDLEDDNLIDE